MSAKGFGDNARPTRNRSVVPQVIYPHLLYSPAVRHCPTLDSLEGDPVMLDLSPASRRFETSFRLYGHLCRSRLPAAGRSFSAGKALAAIQGFYKNGNGFCHMHVRLITPEGLAGG